MVGRLRQAGLMSQILGFTLSPERVPFILDGCRLTAIGIGLMPILA